MYSNIVSFIPKKYFITSGVGTSKVSPLNSFDKALKNAGISEYNLVPVSSIIPAGAVEVEKSEIQPGTIIFVVMARQDGYNGELVSAGVAVGKFLRSDGLRYGLVAEGHGSCDRGELKKKILERLEEMANLRGGVLEEVKVEIASINAPSNEYATAIAAVVFLLG